MTELQRSILVISSALAILLAALILRATGNQAEKARITKTEPRIEFSSAYEKARLLATRFPERATGATGGQDAAKWIEKEMSALGLQTGEQRFDAWIAGEQITGRNVIGVDEGTRAGVIVIIAHYDIPFHVREGAMDDASGVGVLLELARVFSREEQEMTLIFVASDGEEWGMLGARHFVKEYPNLDLIRGSDRDLKRIRAVVSLDYVPLEKPEQVFIHGEGQFHGYVPLWLWMLAEDCVTQAGGDPQSVGSLMHYVSQAVNISGTDQGPFLKAGVPGVDFGGSRSNSPLASKIYHTTMDTSENLKPEIFEVYGKAAELMIRSLDVLGYSMDNNPCYLRTGKRMYVGRNGLLALQLFIFVPLLLATAFQYYNLRLRDGFLRDAGIEFGNIGLFLLPSLSALATLYLLVSRNYIPRYELYPATPLDPFLESPDWKAVAIVAAACFAVWIAVWLLRWFLSMRKKPNFESSKAVCLDVLLTLSIVGFFFNGFAASLFLGPAALLWIWIDRRRGPMGWALNIILAFAAALPLVFLVITFATRLMLGPYVFWYLFLGTGYRFFSPAAVLIAIGAATVGGRLLLKALAGGVMPAPEAEGNE